MLAEELATLAGTSATALVAAMTTDAWHGVRSASHKSSVALESRGRGLLRFSLTAAQTWFHRPLTPIVRG